MKDLGPSGAKYVSEFMKMTGDELKKANDYYKSILSSETKETPVEETEDYLANMQSQIDGIKNWKAELKKLSKTKLAKGIIEELEALGPEGAEQIKYFLNLFDNHKSALYHLQADVSLYLL